MIYFFLKIIVLLFTFFFIVLGLFAVDYVAGFTLLTSNVFLYFIINNLNNWVKFVFQKVINKNKNKKDIRKKRLRQPVYTFKRSVSRSIIFISPIYLIIIICLNVYQDYQEDKFEYGIKAKNSIYFSTTVNSSGDIIIDGFKEKFTYGGSTSLYPLEGHTLSEAVKDIEDKNVQINTGLDLSKVVKSYKINVIPTDEKLKEFNLKEKLKLDIDKTKVNSIFNSESNKKHISLNPIFPKTSEEIENFIIIKSKAMDNLSFFF